MTLKRLCLCIFIPVQDVVNTTCHTISVKICHLFLTKTSGKSLPLAIGSESNMTQ